MATSVKSVVEALHHLYGALLDREFSKTLHLDDWNERELAPLVRAFLLGWFGHGYVSPEVEARLPGSLSGKGRVDFIVDGVAVELAVRCKSGHRSSLSRSVNATEIKKLMKFPGPALLALFDLSKDPLEAKAFNNFREWPSLGRGNHKKSPFQLSYHFRGDSGVPTRFIRRIAVA